MQTLLLLGGLTVGVLLGYKIGFGRAMHKGSVIFSMAMHYMQETFGEKEVEKAMEDFDPRKFVEKS